MAQGEYFLFIDDDNEIEPRMIKELVSLCKSDDRIGLVGPKMYYYESKKLLWWTGSSINLLTSRTIYRGLNSLDTGQYDQPVPTEHIPNVMMVDRKVYEVVGGFDEIYKMSYADSDFAMRAIKAGYKVMYSPKAVTYHKVPLPGTSVSPFKIPMRAYFFARNRVIYMKRFSRPGQFLLFMIIFYWFFTLYFLISTLWRRDFNTLKMHLKGTLHGLKYALIGRLAELPKL